ncbi:hypothetical protein FACS1894137_02950 [Spirochaetia bacterium]|nr:hypothetical protein FACS1894137_02950 [Spirochaetia bacterium]
MFDDVIYLNRKYDELKMEYNRIALSPAYRIGRIVYKLPLFKWLWSFLRKKEIDENALDHNKLFLTRDDLQWRPKVVIYQIVVGNYDTVKSAFPLYPEIYDCFLFTDSDIEAKGWKIKRIPEHIKKLNNPILINRYFKMHPYEFFPEYDYSIYVDGSIQIVFDIRPMLRNVSLKTGLALHRAAYRNCTYREGSVLIRVKKGNKKFIIQQMKRYKDAGFPKKWGLFEAGIIICDLHNKKGEDILDLWWREFLSSRSLRDQISLPYVLWVNGYTIDDIGNFGFSIEENQKLIFHGHLKK